MLALRAYEHGTRSPFRPQFRERSPSVLFLSVADSPIQLFLFGGVELRGVDKRRAAKVLAQSKLAALLAVLALAPDGRMLRRDKLVGLLWPELDQPHARTALRKAIHAVRALLGAAALTTRGDEEDRKSVV